MSLAYKRRKDEIKRQKKMFFDQASKLDPVPPLHFTEYRFNRFFKEVLQPTWKNLVQVKKDHPNG